jgi:signal transduction histidine kinase
LSTEEPLRVAQPNEVPGLIPMTTHDLDVGPVLVLPLRGSQRMHGVLTAARLRGRPAFTADDTDMAAGFANQAAVALELAQARTEQQRAAMHEDRQRIAADLHDHVIQRLFAAGLSLQAVAGLLGPGRATDRILATVADLDRTITQIRTSIFALQQTPHAAARGLRARLLDVAAEQADTLGFDPALRFSGLLDTLPDDLTEDLEAVLREALSNIAQHARARTVEVDLAATPDQITLQVTDDGSALDPTTPRSGLANLRRRAQRHGGTLTLTAQQPRGTRLTWAIPHS